MIVTKQDITEIIDLMFTYESIISGEIIVRGASTITTGKGFDDHLVSNTFVIPNFGVLDNASEKHLYIINKIKESFNIYLDRFPHYSVYKFYEDYIIYVKRYRHGYLISGIIEDLCKNLKKAVNHSYINMARESDSIYKLLVHQYFTNIYILSNYNPLTFDFTDRIIKDNLQYNRSINELALTLLKLAF